MHLNSFCSFNRNGFSTFSRCSQQSGVTLYIQRYPGTHLSLPHRSPHTLTSCICSAQNLFSCDCMFCGRTNQTNRRREGGGSLNVCPSAFRSRTKRLLRHVVRCSFSLPSTAVVPVPRVATDKTAGKRADGSSRLFLSLQALAAGDLSNPISQELSWNTKHRTPTANRMNATPG